MRTKSPGPSLDRLLQSVVSNTLFAIPFLAPTHRSEIRGTQSDFSMIYKLPDGLVGEQIIFRYRYITANSCLPPGYEAYFTQVRDGEVLPSSYWKGSNLGACSYPLPNDGSRSAVWPISLLVPRCPSKATSLQPHPRQPANPLQVHPRLLHLQHSRQIPASPCTVTARRAHQAVALD